MTWGLSLGFLHPCKFSQSKSGFGVGPGLARVMQSNQTNCWKLKEIRNSQRSWAKVSYNATKVRQLASLGWPVKLIQLRKVNPIQLLKLKSWSREGEAALSIQSARLKIEPVKVKVVRWSQSNCGKWKCLPEFSTWCERKIQYRNMVEGKMKIWRYRNTIENCRKNAFSNGTQYFTLLLKYSFALQSLDTATLSLITFCFDLEFLKSLLQLLTLLTQP